MCRFLIRWISKNVSSWPVHVENSKHYSNFSSHISFWWSDGHHSYPTSSWTIPHGRAPKTDNTPPSFVATTSDFIFLPRARSSVLVADWTGVIGLTLQEGTIPLSLILIWSVDVPLTLRCWRLYSSLVLLLGRELGAILILCNAGVGEGE